MSSTSLTERQQLRMRMVSLAYVMRAMRAHPTIPYRAWRRLSVFARQYRTLRYLERAPAQEMPPLEAMG